MKKIFTLFLALMATTALWAEDFEVDGIYYNILTDKTNEVEVSRSPSRYTGSVTIPSTVTYNGTTYSVTSIGGCAFSGCSGLTSVTIGNSVTSIGGYAFQGCSGLTSITIPNSVTSIGDYAFLGCSSLTSITIPNSVTSIGYCAFSDCSGLTSIVVEEGNSIYDSRENCNAIIETNSNTLVAGCKNTTIPNSVTSIGEYAFGHCSGLTSVTIPNSVTSIGGYAFRFCSGLTSIEIPNSVTSIVSYAFSDCSGLTSIVVEEGNSIYDSRENCNAIIETNSNTLVAGCKNTTIPSSVTSIGDYAFYGCSSLSSIEIPNSVTSIGRYTFYGCSSLPVENNLRYADTYLVEAVDRTLSTYSIKEGTKWIGDQAFWGCSGLTSITIPNSVTSIGYAAFMDCSGLTSVTIPNSVTSIGERAFYNCSGLTSPVYNAHCFAYLPTSYEGAYAIPEGIKQIVGYAFYGCSGLTSVTIPNSVTSIRYYAFLECYGLTSVNVFAEVPPTLGTDAFLRVSTTIPVYVPCGSAYAYQSAEGWNKFTNIQGLLAEYSIAVGVNDSIMGTSRVDYNTCSEGAQITAIPNCGYHFVQWSDGNTDNPRTLELTQDTILTAEFAQTYSGQCGDNLYWSYDETTKTISITGSGDMYDYTKATQPWYLFQEQITEVTTSNTTTGIGTSAFEGCVRLAKVSLGSGMGNIAANAFAGCNRLYDIYCYASYPPFADESSFANYNVYVYIPCEYQRAYTLDVIWGKFKFIECIGADNVENTEDVTITPGITDVTITWPTEDNAYHYVIEIKKDDEVFCTLTFNADGQLLNIAFAPGRSGNKHPAQYAEQAGNGYRFTVTGLEESTHYTYNIDVRDIADKTINSHAGEFTTQSITAVSDIQSPMTDCQKLLRNGQLVIVRDGVEYNAQGQIVKE